MTARERLSCGVGNVFNDLYRQLLVSFEILFFMNVIQLSASQAGLVVLIGQIADATISPLTGYLGDRVNVPLLSSKIGRRKSWHLVATAVMTISFPLLINRCFLCDNNDQSWLPLVYFGLLSAVTNLCYNMVEINHLAFISTVTEKVEECTALSAVRTVFTFLSGVYVYAIAWTLFGQDSGHSLGPKNRSDFTYLCWIVTGTGVVFATIFYIGAKEPKKRVRRSTVTYMDFMNADRLLTGVLEMGGRKRTSRKTDAQKNILAHVFVDMLLASSYDKICEGKKREVIGQLENRERRISFVKQFVAAMFNEEETKVEQNTTQKAEAAAEKSQNEDTRHHLVSELQTLDRDRKRSFVVRVIDGLLSRLDHNQSETSTDNIEDDVAAGDNHDKNEAVAIYLKQETGLENIQRKDTEKVHKVHAEKVKKTKFGIDKEDRVDDSTEELVLTKYRHRGNVCRIQNLASEYDRGEEAENCSPCDPSGVRKQIKSVAFSLPVTPSATQTDKKSKKDFQLDMPDEKKFIKTGVESERRHIHLQQQHTDSEESGLHSPLPLHRPAKRRPKTVKGWLMDSNVYKVALIFTCSRLVQDAVYTYLPLFLTERLQFAKEAIAYFPLVLLITATFASTLCEKLNTKIGSKWSYLLATSLVMSGAVWCYFQTPSTRQATYAPVILIGFGMSVMYVMALAFIAELIGENKETSGSVISIITVIARLSSGGLVIGIQAFYPKTDTQE